VLAALVWAASLVASSASAQVSPATRSTAMVCTNGPNFTLKARTGRIATPDGNSLFMWGFANDAPGAGAKFQMPGPVLCVNQGATVTVTLNNGLGEPASIVFPGQDGVSSTGGSPGLLAREASPGGSVTYSFTASQPGTYLYESGSNPHKQIQMGLYGVLVVRPSMGAAYAYNDSTTRFDPAREYLLLLHDIDPDLHHAVELGRPYDVTTMHDRYWTINGRSFPDTISDNNASWLPAQPYSSLVRLKPYDPSTNPYPALIRYANAGMVNHPFHPHGNHMQVIARDGRRLRGAGGQDTSFQDFTRTVGSGQSYDMLFSWIDREHFSPTNPVPVAIPGLQNLAFKDNATFYSGSPYLGKKGSLPAGTTSYNRCGEIYFPFHSHALNEFQNFDEGFGGMATLARVDPPVAASGTNCR
jgi:FtsP/CotA-like multicopper oxidase with cupredoxin domain